MRRKEHIGRPVGDGSSYDGDYDIWLLKLRGVDATVKGLV